MNKIWQNIVWAIIPTKASGHPGPIIDAVPRAMYSAAFSFVGEELTITYVCTYCSYLLSVFIFAW
jgi:hypothetical protein